MQLLNSSLNFTTLFSILIGTSSNLSMYVDSIRLRLNPTEVELASGILPC